MKKSIYSRTMIIVFAIVVLFQLGGVTTIAANAAVTTKSVKVTSVKLNTAKLNWTVGKTGAFTVTVSPSNASNKSVTWKSSNTKVATISSNGKITAVGVGTATITCTANDGSEKSTTCLVTVTSGTTAGTVKVTSVKLNTAKLNWTVGKTGNFTTTVSPANANNKSVTWKSSDTKVATISSNGKIIAVGAGTATITCTANDGSGKSATCVVTVTSKDTVAPKLGEVKHLTQMYSGEDTTSFTMEWTKATDNITPQSKLKYYLYQSEGKSYGDNISQWESSAKLLNSSGSLDINSLPISGLDNKKSYYFKLIVEDEAHNKTSYTTEVRKASSLNEVKVTSVALNTTKLNWTVGKTGNFTAKVLPSNATNKGVTWKSSNTKVATISSNGKITAVGAGTATITCTANDGSGKSATCLVTVQAGNVTTGSFVTKPQLILKYNDINLTYKVNQSGTYTLKDKEYDSNGDYVGEGDWGSTEYKSGYMEEMSISDILGKMEQGEYAIFEVASEDNPKNAMKSEKISVTKSGAMNLDVSKITASGSGEKLVLKANKIFEKGIYVLYAYINNTHDCYVITTEVNGNTSSLNFDNYYDYWKEGKITSMQIARIYDISIASNGSATCKVERSKEFIPSK